MRKVCYIRKRLFESSSKFENRVNSILKNIANTDTIKSVEWNKTTLVVFYESDIKRPTIKGFSK